jgi:hypothetical protein
VTVNLGNPESTINFPQPRRQKIVGGRQGKDS